MSTTQKRGFRLPWSSDPTPEDPSDAAERLATFLEAAEGHVADGDADAGNGASGAVDAELGKGPFHVTPDEAPTDVEQPVQDAAGESEAVVLESVVEGRADGSAVENPGSREPQQRDGADAWPTADRPAEPQVTTEQPVAAAEEPAPAVEEPAPAVEEPTRTPRRDNPLVAGLVKAMREAAEASRNETMDSLHAEAHAQVEAVRTGATDEVAALRQQADDDIGEIREWAKAETARIKQESEQRIVDRRETLDRDLEAHALAVDARAAQVEETVAAYEAEMESFFEQLLAEADPARLATLAERAPEPPILSELPAVQHELPAVQHEATRSVAAEPPAEPAADAATGDMTLEPSESAVQDGAADAAVDAEAEASEAWAPGSDTMEPGEALGPEAAAAAEAEALEGLNVGESSTDASGDREIAPEGEASAPHAGPGRQRVVVTGLATVAGISAFKGALGRLSGVESVSVMAGDPGTFVFTVSHDGSTDVAAMLPQLSDFEAHVTGGDDETLQVAAREPAA